MSYLNEQRDVFSVSRLNSEIRAVLEGSFPLIWVEGEISNLASPRSGHSYFSLKDQHAQVRCALFHSKRQLLRFQPKDGDQVLARARVSLYETRGEFQLIIEHMELAGLGRLQRAFEALKAKLDKEGLFARAGKQELPAFPRCLGIVTSTTGAALQDILNIIQRRYPLLPVRIYPTLVQGEEAPQRIIQALRQAEREAQCDVLILARGGGSLEDLWAFNDEQLARVIAGMSIPVVSAVGHEIDFTIADFVADHRAPTPSAAAELVTPDGRQLAARLRENALQLTRSMQRLISRHQHHLQHLEHRLYREHPAARMLQYQQYLDELHSRLERGMEQRLMQYQQRLLLAGNRLQAQSPMRRLKLIEGRLRYQWQRLSSSMQQQLSKRRHRLSETSRSLHNLSPLHILSRGYSITLDHNSGQIIHDSRQLQPGQCIESRLEKGRVISIVEETWPSQ